MTPPYDWQQHEGKDIPVHPKAVVLAKLRDGTMDERRAKLFDWSQIAEYRLVKAMTEHEARLLAGIWREKYNKNFQAFRSDENGKKVWKVVEVGVVEYQRVEFSVPCFKCGAARDCRHREG